jgi:peptidoglycan/LPS O-acetylase OafA/YrhL
MVFAIGAFFYINRDYIFLSPMWMLSLLFFAAGTHNTKAFVVAYTLLLAYGVFYLAFGRNVAWFQRVGDYSYGVYLYGWLAQQLVLMWLPEMSNQLNAVLAGALALGCAIASWHLIEKPALSLKKRFSFSKTAVQP